MHSNPLVCIIILNWNGYAVTKDCIISLSNITYTNYKIILVDNGSKDGSVELLKKDFPDSNLDFLALPKNFGFTGGNNQGILWAKKEYNPEYYLLLNNDTVVEKDFLDKMVDQIETKSDAYAAVGKVLYYDRPEKIWFAGGKVSALTGVVTHFGLGENDEQACTSSEKTYFMNGCCALIKKQAIDELGVLDDRFFANSEDADYSLRIIKSGHSIYYVHDARIYHKVSHSFQSNKGRWLAFYLAARGIVLLQNKHLSKFSLPFFYAAYSTRWVFYLTLKLLLSRETKSIKAIYMGTWDGITNRLRFVS